MLPIAGTIKRTQPGASVEIAHHHIERCQTSAVSLTVQSGADQVGGSTKVVRMESRCIANVGENLNASLDDAHWSAHAALLNAFARDQLHRFQREEGAK